MHSYEYPRPALAVDFATFGFTGEQIEILLIRRKNDPYKNFWALPGGFLEENETCENAALRELQEETGLEINSVSLTGVYSKPDRDPRTRVISVAYFALFAKPSKDVLGMDDAEEAKWFPIDNLPALAFDHDIMFKDALQKLEDAAKFKPLGADIFAPDFDFEELIKLYSAIYRKNIDGKLLEKQLFQHNLLERNAENTKVKFKTDIYHKLSQSGLYIDLN